MVTFPSTLGGGNWNGLAYDPTRGLVFTNVMNIGQVARMESARIAAAGRKATVRATPVGRRRSAASGTPRTRSRARRRRSASWWR